MYDHPNFNSAKIAIVCVDGDYIFTDSIKNEALAKLCKNENIDEGKVLIHNWMLLGDDEKVTILY